MASYPVRLPREERKQKTSPCWDNEPPNTSPPLLPLLLHLSLLALVFSAFTLSFFRCPLVALASAGSSAGPLPTFLLSLLPVLAVSAPCNSVPSISSAKIGGKAVVNVNHTPFKLGATQEKGPKQRKGNALWLAWVREGGKGLTVSYRSLGVGLEGLPVS